jgi:tetratricopeptide (TPR) repeat protein
VIADIQPALPSKWQNAKDFIMRYYPAALALSLLCGVTASVSNSAPPQMMDPRAGALQAQGRAALATGDADKATDSFEAALAIQPGNRALVMDLADAARRQGMQGKALHYYRVVLESDPENLTALAGEGAALAEKGALEKARRNLARISGMCGGNCPEVRFLASAIARGPAPKMVSAEDVKSKPVVSAN